MKRNYYAILGLGLSGKSVANYLISKGHCVIGCDNRVGLPTLNNEIKDLVNQGLRPYSDKEFHLTKECEVLILSPGIPLTHPLCLEAKELGIEIIGETEFACRRLNNPLIGITGTNGKTTVTLQIAHTLNFFGIRAHAMGNIGEPLSNLLNEPKPDTIIVTELSSYQLETMESRTFETGIILNISHDHLDRYLSMKEYGEAKFRLGLCLKKGNSLYVSEAIHKEYEPLINRAPFEIIVYDKKEMIPYFESYNSIEKQNYAAVHAICRRWGIKWNDILIAAKTFKKGPHRIEFVSTVNGVNFYDDSKGTNVDAVIKAIETIQGKIVLIAGGLAKGTHFSCWLEPFHDKVDAICVIGSASQQIRNELGNFIPVFPHSTLKEAVQMAFELAEAEKKTVLLSPGCSSLDMFTDYAHRGEVFKQCVRELEN